MSNVAPRVSQAVRVPPGRPLPMVIDVLLVKFTVPLEAVGPPGCGNVPSPPWASSSAEQAASVAATATKANRFSSFLKFSFMFIS